MGTGNDQDKRVDDQLPLEDEPHTLSDLGPNQLAGNSPDDIDEALAWLEQLAAKQGISVDELTSRHPEALEHSFPELGLAYSDDLPEWLKEEPPARRLREFPSSAGETAALDDIPDWLLTETPSSLKPVQDKESADLSDELDSRLDWLAEMGKKDELAEMPTVRWRPEDAGLADSGIPPSADFNDLDESGMAGQIPSPDMADLRSNGPEDLDEAMAWLEELATSQETPLQELPSVADRILASRLMAESGLELDEPPSEEPLFASTFSDEAFAEPEAQPIEVANFPDNLDDAMDYLDKLATIRQQSATPVSESPVVEESAAAEELNVETTFDDEAEEGVTEATLAEDSFVDSFVEDEAGAATGWEATSDIEGEAEPAEAIPVVDSLVEDEDYEVEAAVEFAEEAETADEVDWFLAEMLTPESDEAVAAEVAAEDEPEESELDEAAVADVVDTADLADEVDAADEVDEIEEAYLEEEAADLSIEGETFAVEDGPDELLIFTGDKLEAALTELDQLSLPPGVTLQTLNEGFADADTTVLNGNGQYPDLNSTLLWLEQVLDSAADEPATTETAESEIESTEPAEPARETDELLLSVARLDDELVAELTADMPENPDEALEWLLSLADEVESEAAGEVEIEIEAEDELADSAAEQIPHPSLPDAPQARNIRIYDMPEPLSVEESLVGDQAEAVAEEEPGKTVLDRVESPTFSAGELPEMPDDPDEAIAWIERLAALEAQESAITVGQSFADDFDEDLAVDFDEAIDAVEVEEALDSEIAEVEEEEAEEADYSGYEVESALVVEGAEAEDATADDAAEAPAIAEQTESPVSQPRRPHERWLDQLQPPSWAKK